MQKTYQDGIEDVEELNKIIKDFCNLTLGGKCVVLSRLLSNLEAHVTEIDGNCEELINSIIERSKGVNQDGE